MDKIFTCIILNYADSKKNILEFHLVSLDHSTSGEVTQEDSAAPTAHLSVSVSACLVVIIYRQYLGILAIIIFYNLILRLHSIYLMDSNNLLINNSWAKCTPSVILEP